jgi:hypothetical protein
MKKNTRMVFAYLIVSCVLSHAHQDGGVVEQNYAAWNNACNESIDVKDFNDINSDVYSEKLATITVPSVLDVASHVKDSCNTLAKRVESGAKKVLCLVKDGLIYIIDCPWANPAQSCESIPFDQDPASYYNNLEVDGKACVSYKDLEVAPALCVAPAGYEHRQEISDDRAPYYIDLSAVTPAGYNNRVESFENRDVKKATNWFYIKRFSALAALGFAQHKPAFKKAVSYVAVPVAVALAAYVGYKVFANTSSAQEDNA